MTKLKRVVLNFLSVNCYLVWDEVSGKGLIVDPGSSPELIVDAVSEAGFVPQGILLTHHHVDHIGAVPDIASKYGIPVWISPRDVPGYFSPENALLPWMPAVQGLPEPVKECPTAGLSFRIIPTPGHTPGGCCFYFESDGFILTGDTLFEGTYGRTDFPGGSYETIMESILQRLLTLPPETKVYPGHEESTTIGREQENPMYR